MSSHLAQRRYSSSIQSLVSFPCLQASVHLPRIGHATKGFNWYGTERLIRKHLASRGVPTFIYYHSRSRSTNATSACASSSAHQSPDSAEPSSSLATPQLPSFMAGVHVFFYNLPATERKKLARYLLTYDGDEEEVMSGEVTHIVAEVENDVQAQDLQDLRCRSTGAVVLHKAWLEACFSKQRLVSTARFKHTLA